MWATGGGKTERILEKSLPKLYRHCAWNGLQDKINGVPTLFPSDSKDLGFGRIEFEGQEGHLMPYVRIPWKGLNLISCKETELSAIAMAALCYVENVWELPRPKLLISITGGAQDFNMNRSKENVLYKLMETARKTSAWIITGGTEAGIMKYVGMYPSISGSIVANIFFYSY